MIKVKVDQSKPLDYFIKLFNRKVTSEEVINEVNERRFFIKPSQKRQLKLKERAKKIKQKNRSNQHYL